MGLDTSHNAWHGSYSSFNNWRRTIANAIGIPLDLMRGHYSIDGPFDPLSLVQYAVNAYPQSKDQFERHRKNFPLHWEAFRPNPLHELLDHSDCDGELKWENCQKMADELRSILPQIDDENWKKGATEKFIAGLELAFSQRENIDFH